MNNVSTKKLVIVLLMILLSSISLFSQPMSGNYTIGGTNNHFATLMEAKYALTARGISGPVTFNIRPGIYMEDNGNKTVLRLDSLISGLSETNRITFQPDAALGGNVDNVRLRFNRINSTVGDRDLIHIRTDYITIRSLTIEDIDSSHTFNNSLIRLENLPNNINPTVDEFILEGCKLIGTPFIQIGSGFLGTDHGITSTQNVGDMIIRGNTFIRLLRAVSIVNGSAVAQGTGIVEDNIILEGYRGMSGTGNFLGAGIEVCFSNSIVRRNIIDFENTANAGRDGITLISPITAVIEKNIIRGHSARGIFVTENVNPSFTPDSIIIANNMITGTGYQVHGSVQAYGIQCEARNTWIVFNTIVIPPVTVSSTAIRVAKSNCRVFNNIIHSYGRLGFTIVFDQGNQVSEGLISDHNVFYKDSQAGNGPFVLRNGVQYPNLTEYQAATGLDTNSIVKQIDLVDLNSDLHLSECQSQDPDLAGIPITGITDDFDGSIRSLTEPTVGADEAVINANPLFGKVFSENLQGASFSIAAGKFDNIIGDGIAVPDYANKQVLLYHNNASINSFSLSNTLSTGFSPISVVFHDFDDDGNLDLIVSGQNPDGIKVFWGDGIGNFPQMSEVEGPLALNMLPEPHKIFEDFQTIFVPSGQFFGYLFHTGNREICFDYQHSDPLGTIDTLPNFINGAVIGNFGGDEMIEVAGVSNSTGHFALISNIHQLELGLGSCFAFSMMADYSEQHYGTGWYSYANSIIQGDFDNDGDIDFITTGFSSSNVIFIRNEGSFNFTHEIIQTDDLARALAVLDYDNDGDLDFAAINNSERNGLTLFVNDGLGNFAAKLNCFQNLINGSPTGVVARDFDLDGFTDIAITTLSDQFFVLYNLNASTSVNPQNTELIPEKFSLDQNYPNPFNPTTIIRYSIPQVSIVTLKVYNILGEEIMRLVDDEKSEGIYEVKFNGSQLASGIYFYRLIVESAGQSGSFTQVKKMILLR